MPAGNGNNNNNGRGGGAGVARAGRVRGFNFQPGEIDSMSGLYSLVCALCVTYIHILTHFLFYSDAGFG